MKNKILVTQREYYFPDRKERVDALDQEWTAFLSACGFRVIPIPNRTADPCGFLDDDTVGILITGGGDIHADQKNRDKVELELLAGALLRNIPVLGICRGAQLIADFYGWKLTQVTGHVNERHGLLLNQQLPDSLRGYFTNLNSVNSFHSYGLKITDIPEQLQWIASDSSGGAEAFSVIGKRILSLMWHPERESPFRKNEILLFQQFFLGNFL